MAQPNQQLVDPGTFGKLLEQEGRAGHLAAFIRTHGHLHRATGGRNRLPEKSPFGADTLLYSTSDGTKTGIIQRYLAYNHLNQPIKRVDVVGPAHSGIPTPHVREYVIRKQQYLAMLKRPRSAFIWEIP